MQAESGPTISLTRFITNPEVKFLKEKPLLVLAAGFLFLFHLFSLSISPLPWFDETYFASMAMHFSETGEFMAPIGPLIDYYYPQSKAYGPGYFLVLSGIIRTFGLGITQIRFPGLAFGFLFVFVVFKILQQQKVSFRLSVAAAVLLVFDVIFVQSIHSARMDSMALFFAGSGIFFELRALKTKRLYDFVYCGIAFGLALLTTPRIAVCLIGPCLVLLGYFIKDLSPKSFLQGFIVLMSVALLYSIWVFWGFGGYSEAWQYFFGKPREVIAAQNLADSYIGGNLFLPVFQKPSIALAIILALAGLLNAKIRRHPLFLICLINIPAFYLLVADTGIYSILNMPFVYLLMALSLKEISLPGKLNPLWVLIPVFLINFGIFCVKNLIVWTFANQRNAETVLTEVKKRIPKGSRVIGDDCFFYVIVQSGSDFQYLERGSHTPMRREYHLNQFKFNYIIVQDPPQSAKEFGLYAKFIPMRPVGYITMKPNSAFGNFLESILKRFSFKIPPGYKGTIYKRL